MTPVLTVLGERYELLGVIGAGGFCEVWRAHDRVLDREVAVKLLDAKYARDPEALARFRAEAQNAGCLTHVNIARVYDFGEPDEHGSPAYLVMELVEGPTLADVLAEGPLDPARAMDVVAQAAAGLQAAHAAGLVHRDIKPGNLLLGPGGIVKVADFGISHTLDSTPLTCTGVVIGSPGYVAPERASGARASQPSDLYALGVVAYECLTGAPPFEGTGLEVALAHLNRPFPPLPPAIPAEIAALVARLTDKDPAGRPASAGVVAEHAIALRDQPRGIPELQAAAGVAGPAGTAGRLHRLLPVRTVASFPSLASLPSLARAAGSIRSQANMTRWRVLVAVAAAISGLGIFLVSSVDDPSAARAISASKPAAAQLGPAGRAGQAGQAAAVQTVTVSRSLIGQPVVRAVTRLRGQGLRVYVIWRRASGHRPGRVLAIRPLGPHRVSSLVTVIAVRAPAHRTSARHHHAWSSPRHPGGTAMSAPGHAKGHGHGKPHGHGGDGNSQS
ncbi:MAG TPA: serine/threonine-protein kinase [Streptosporangiaceae bacterium]